MGKTILVLLDACRFDAASDTAGYLEHLISVGLGAKYKVRGELPSMSRPMYETSLTGLPAHVHGVVDNNVVRRSRCQSVFDLCRENGLTTAAAAYFWMAELYSKAPFDFLNHRYLVNGTGAIQNGIFYFEDQYPDSHLFLDGEFLRKTYEPDFLLLHSMNIDYMGHIHGGGSKEYMNAARSAAEFLARLLPGWLEDGYHVVITADHGMGSMGYHGGPGDEQRVVPLYLLGTDAAAGDYTHHLISQLNLAPLLCRLLEIPPACGMMQKLEVKF